jgi:hypothetical protein
MKGVEKTAKADSTLPAQSFPGALVFLGLLVRLVGKISADVPQTPAVPRAQHLP